MALFYKALKDELAPHKPVLKFVCIKSVLFLTFWQSVLLAALSQIEVVHDIGQYTAEDVSAGIQNFLICFEMLVAAIAHRYAFSYHEYTGSPR
jgi:hypothetical protein